MIEKTFEEHWLKKLTFYYKLNFTNIVIGFLVIIIRYTMFNTLHLDEPHYFVLFHLMIVFFLYFYLDLIKKGNNIQQENDLTI